MSVQAFIVAGGWSSSVQILLPGAKSWTPLAPLPHALVGAQASIVRGRIRVTGGSPDNLSYRSEVTVHNYDDGYWL